jgi:tetratricopeptide (TPR) repeat protein
VRAVISLFSGFRLRVLSSIGLALILGACSIRTMAVNSLADSLAEGAGVYATDDDPELVRDALPFALKTFEGLLEEQPDHEDLLLATCTGFTQYANAFVEGDALYVEETDWESAEALEQRAVRLYLRARDYCLRGLELRSPGIGSRLRLEPEGAADGLGADAVPLLFWTGASWGSAIALSLDRPELVVDSPAVRALMERALALNEDWEDGALHEAMIALESLPEAMGGSAERARRHFERALELSDRESAGAYLAMTHLAIAEGDRDRFVELLEAVVALDPDDRPETRLATILAQRRARWMLDRTDEYFLEDLEGEAGVEK